MTSQAIEHPYAHLAEDYRPWADRSDEDRIKFISKERFLYFDHTEAILNKLEYLYRQENAVRAQGLLLVGESLMGKTSILYRFMKNHPATDNPEGDEAVVPIVSVQFPEKAKSDLYREILRSLNASPSSTARSGAVRSDCVDLLRAIKMKVLVIDELHNIIVGSPNEQEAALNSIKYLMNETGRPIVGAGTLRALTAVKASTQMTSRLRGVVIPRFTYDRGFCEALCMFEQILPLRKPSNLDNPDLSAEIHRLTSGVTGHIADLLNHSAVEAINDKSECITSSTFSAIGWIAPSGVQDN